MVTQSAAIGMSSPPHNQWTNGLSVSNSLKRANLHHKEATLECLCSASWECPLCHGNAENLIIHSRTAVGTLMKLYWLKLCHSLLSLVFFLTIQQLTWSAARTPGAPGPLAGAGCEPSPPRSPREPWCSLPWTHPNDLGGGDDKQEALKAGESRRNRHRTS